MPQELFITHCTTCRARLKVYDQEAIGQILSCPKCGSMVQVAPPPDWKPPVAAAPPVKATPTLPAISQPTAKVAPKPAAAPAAPPAALGVPNVAPQKTPRAPARPAATISAPPKLPAPPLPPGQQPAMSRAANAAGSASRVITVNNPGATKAAAASAVAAAALVEPPPVMPPPLQGSVSLTAGNASADGLDAGVMSASRWSKIAARMRQDWWMLAGGFLAGVVVGGGVWLTVLLSGDHKPADPASSTDSGKATVAANPASPAEQAGANQAAYAAAAAKAAAEPEERMNADKPAQKATADDEPLKPFPTKRPASDEVAAETADNKPEILEEPGVKTAEAGAAEAAADASAEAPASEVDGADLLGGQLAIPQDVPPLAGSPVAMDEKSTDDEANDKKPSDEKIDGDKTGDDKAADATADATDPRAESTQQELAAERLASVLPPLDFERVALNKYVAFLGQYTTVTIKIDRAALLKAGIDYKSPVTVKRANTTVAQALRDALGPLELTYRLEKDTLVITPAVKRAAR